MLELPELKRQDECGNFLKYSIKKSDKQTYF